MTDIIVKKINESFVEIQTSEGILRELNSWYKSRMTNYRFHPLVKQGYWDGYITFLKGNKLPIGLSYSKLDKFAQNGKYTLLRDWENEFKIENWDEFIKSLNLPFDKPWEHQIKYAKHALEKKNVNLEAVTASGKSLVAYLIVRYLINQGKKILIVVPLTSLVEQLFSDFESYGWEDCWEYTQKIYSGQSKEIVKPVTITTWQSMFRKKEVFKLFDVLIVDESSTAKAKSLVGIAEKSINAEWRIGMSGTYPEPNTPDWYTIVGSFGDIVSFTIYQELKEKGIISDWEIINVILNHSDSVCKSNFENTHVKKKNSWVKNVDSKIKDYQKEVEFVNGLEVRNKFITDMSTKLKENTIVLFTRKEHGKELFKLISKDNETYYIDGDVDVLEREKIRKLIETKNGLVLVFSFGTFGMGQNVKNIHNIIFASNYKSKIKVLQAIGRGLRKLEGKDMLRVYDIIDDLTYKYKEERKDKTYFNHFMRHKDDRLKIYDKVGFDKVKTIKIDLIKGD